MTQVYFHCSTTERVLLNYGGAQVADLTEAREEAALVMRALIAAPGPEDWRDWMLHICDDLDDELFSLSFAAELGPLH